MLTRLQQLRRALTVYRLAFGHARQEDVVEHLLARVPAEKREQLCEELRINLAPPIVPAVSMAEALRDASRQKRRAGHELVPVS